MILALAYVLCCLSAIWSQFQIIGRSLRWKWVLIWYVTAKHQRLSSIRVLSLSIIRLVNYSVTNSLIYKFYTIGDTQSFSSITSIAPSRDFNVEILTGVWLCHRRSSYIEVFLSWKTEYLDDGITTIRHVVSKMATVEGRFYLLTRNISISLIIFYYCIYFRLSSTMRVIVWNSMRLIRNAGFGF